MNQINIQYYKSPVGEIILGSYGDKLCLADWRYRRMRSTVDRRIQNGLNAQYSEETSDVIEATKEQMQAYFTSKRQQFDIDILMVGTPFQKSVWHALQNIPYGDTASYIALARSINHEKAVRAVASANGANAISIIIPCHRIIGANGDLVGYAGGLPAKKKLLILEKNLFS